jgi:hypothetical protein
MRRNPIHQAPLALGSDGTVLVNAREFFTDPVHIEDLVQYAKSQPGKVFVGLALDPSEVRRLVERLSHGHAEAAAYAVGESISRQRRKKRRQR